MNAKEKHLMKKLIFIQKHILLTKWKFCLSRQWRNLSTKRRRNVSSTIPTNFSLLEPGQDDDIYAALNEGKCASNPYTLARYVLDLKNPYPLDKRFNFVAKLTPKLTGTIKTSYNFQKSNRDNYYPLNTTRGRKYYL